MPCDEFLDEDGKGTVEWARCKGEQYEREAAEKEAEAEKKKQARECFLSRVEFLANVAADGALVYHYASGIGAIYRGGVLVLEGAAINRGLIQTAASGRAATSGFAEASVGAMTVTQGGFELSAGVMAAPEGFSSIPLMNTVNFVQGGGFSACGG